MNNLEVEVKPIFDEIKSLVINSRSKVYRTVNTEMLNLYWNIGKIIMNIQDGKKRASYNEHILEKLSEKLINEFGNGFSLRNLKYMRGFYVTYPIRQTLSAELSWCHYLELIKIKDNIKRSFYMQEAINSKWSVRELQRQKNSLLFERISISKNKDEVLELSKKGLIIKDGRDLIKDPFVLEFLDIKENTDYLETDLEKNILKHLKEFLLELGNGFMFVGSQKRITLQQDHFYPDLVFYNRLAHCFVIIDLKIGKVTHQDIGQMQMYVNYYDREIKNKEENQTVGILLCTSKNETVVKFTLNTNNHTIYAPEYKLNFPTEQDFINIIEEEKKNCSLNEI